MLKKKKDKKVYEPILMTGGKDVAVSSITRMSPSLNSSGAIVRMAQHQER